MDSDRPSIGKLGFQEQGEDSISYGEGLKPESEYSDPIIDGDPSAYRLRIRLSPIHSTMTS